jgi:eukaryotic-like serine/threonine-protein kinase
MTPERWQKVKEIFEAVLERAPAERSAFLATACGDDKTLRGEVESLLAMHERDGSFIDSPAYQHAAGLLVQEPAELKPGQTIETYEIVSFISRGGMGEVYLAKDKRLGRRVALKLLPVSFAKDTDRLRRFEQEARAASALNHPNIITIHEIREANSTFMITTEFVEGETLRQFLSHETLDLLKTLHIAIQIADALAAAHQAGIIHRDIKPDNIMLRPDGYVKVLDFGLAKLADPSSPMSMAEAQTKKVRTGSGVIIGTVGYMSPEQARGKAVDPRSDIFSLGAVIYEMVAGRKPFDGETPSDVVASILKTEPALLSHLEPNTPAELVRIVTKALRKDRELRYQVIKDMLLDLRSLKEELDFQSKLNRVVTTSDTSQSAATSEQPRASAATNEVRTAVSTITHSLTAEIQRHKTGVVLGIVVIGLALVAGALGIYKLISRRTGDASTSAPQVLRTTQIPTSTGLEIPALSPDGNAIALSSNGEIYVKPLTPGARDIQVTSDSQGNSDPAWSPDGKLIAFCSQKRGGIYFVPASGGMVRQLTDFGAAPAWSSDGSMIAFQSERNSMPPTTIWIVSSRGGGDPKQVTRMGNPSGGHSLPAWSPDGKRIAFNAYDGTGNGESWSIGIDGKDLRIISTKLSNPVYSPDGEFIYGTSGFSGSFVLQKLRISPLSGAPVGDPIVIQNTGLARIHGSLTISSDGRKIAYNAQTLSGSLMSLRVSPQSGEADGTPTPLAQSTSYRKGTPVFSRDGKKIAFGEFRAGAHPRIWVMDQDGQNATPLTDGTAIEWAPNWSPDNDTIAFQSDREGKQRIWATSLSTGRTRLFLDPGLQIGWPRLSPNGKQIAFNSTKSGTINVWTIPVEGGPARQLTFDNESVGWPSWSPDGKLLAVQIKRGGNSYIATMPSAGGDVTQLTFETGLSFINDWSPDGDKILFAGQRDGIWNVYWFSRSTREVKQLTHYNERKHYVRYTVWSPLGNQIVYEYTETTGNVWLVELK